MVGKHVWSKEKARIVNQLSNQRKRTTKQMRSLNKKRVYCDQEECESYVLDLRDHYRNKHSHLLKKNVTVPAKTFYTNENRGIITSTDEEYIQDNFIEDNINSEAGSSNDDETSAEPTESIENIIVLTIENCDKDPYEPPTEDFQLNDLITEMIGDFNLWQCDPQGGGNKQVTVDHNSDIKRTCKDLEVSCLSVLLDDSKLWRMFYQKKSSAKWTGQTARGYMVALKKFKCYVIKDERHQK